ncbi:MAG: FAD-binding protein [Gemmatimonadetes bacterium]|nr:GMC family oxidoreductase [Gemmatimonadota bacterium]NIQ59440.1 GMC family oxidoreductase [Gemmatimonadota bacterium]NIU79626.1 FAD-binding protein [Gammaproteobacteria bacterium]NIX48207.1 FAD-binding protein [Gemmatimonadota bacterium]NIY12640.1 FAD-binding protein [Gemmatimonadota bacterium]
MRSRKTRSAPHDVVIVGSGAGGGMAAYALTRAGANVLVLEAGPEWYASADTTMFTWPYETPRRGGATPERPFGEHDACIGGWEVDGEPYTTAPGERFLWWRARMLGGRTNHWGRISLRFGPDDFRRGDLDGLSPNWPISYDDVKPYYDAVDRLVGIFGSVEGIHNEPDGIFQPPPRPRCYELAVRDACDALDITCIPARLSILTRPLPGRQPCHYCAQCNRGCQTLSNFSSPDVLIRPALATGRLTLVTNAMAREVTVGRDGRATGVAYIDKATGEDEHVEGRVVVLAASACSSARILLNSTSSRFPDGLANTGGVVGKYLTDTTGTGVSGFIPKLVDTPPHNEDGVGGMHVYMPWWLDNAGLDFPRGYHIEVGGGKDMPQYGFGGGIQRYPAGGGWGASLKEDYRRYYGATVHFAGRGEMIPSEDCYCEIDPDGTVDRWGIPVLRFHWQWSDHERAQARHMQETFRSIIREMGGEPFGDMPGPDDDYGLAAGGQIIHELGTTRMGDDPATSAVNGFGQAHDVRNLFVADGGPFVSQADKNPTWTILALSMRTSEYIADQMNRGAL